MNGKQPQRKNQKQILWRFVKYYRSFGYVASVDEDRKEIVVFLPGSNITFIADVSSYLNVEKIKPGRGYDLTFAIYDAKVSSQLTKMLAEELERPFEAIESIYTREYLSHGLKYVKETLARTDTIYRFELLNAVDMSYASNMQLQLNQRFRDAVELSYKVPTKYRWRHLLGF